jgi:hypothetical protein
VLTTEHAPQSSAPPQPSFVGPHSTLSSSHDFGVHVGADVAAGVTLPMGTQRFLLASHSRLDGQGQVLFV